MRTGPDLLIAANDALLLLHEKIATHDARVYEAIKNCVEGVTTEVVFDDGTVLSTKDMAFHLYYLHYMGTRIQTFGTIPKPWNDLTIKESLKIAKDVVEKLSIPCDELPPNVTEWLKK